MSAVFLGVGVWLALAGFALQARIKVRMPANLGDKLKVIASRGEVHEFIDFLTAYPAIKASTIVDANDNTLLHMLAEQNQAEMIAYTQVLDINHHSINIKNKDGIDPIELATAQGSDAAQRVLTAVARNVDVMLPERVAKVSNRAIAKAVGDGDEVSARILTEALLCKIASEDKKPGDAVSKALSEPLGVAISKHQNDIFDFLVDTSYPYYESLDRLTMVAVQSDNDHAVQFFINYRHSTTDRLTDLLGAAVYWRAVKVARVLAEAGADGREWSQMLRLLTGYGAEVSRYHQRELEKLDLEQFASSTATTIIATLHWQAFVGMTANVRSYHYAVAISRNSLPTFTLRSRLKQCVI